MDFSSKGDRIPSRPTLANSIIKIHNSFELQSYVFMKSFYPSNISGHTVHFLWHDPGMYAGKGSLGCCQTETRASRSVRLVAVVEQHQSFRWTKQHSAFLFWPSSLCLVGSSLALILTKPHFASFLCSSCWIDCLRSVVCAHHSAFLGSDCLLVRTAQSWPKCQSWSCTCSPNAAHQSPK